MSLRPKEDMLIPEIREHVSLTDDYRVSLRHDQGISFKRLHFALVENENSRSESIACGSAAQFSFKCS